LAEWKVCNRFDVAPSIPVIATSADNDIYVLILAEVSTRLHTFVDGCDEIAIWRCDEGRNAKAGNAWSHSAIKEVFGNLNSLSYFLFRFLAENGGKYWTRQGKGEKQSFHFAILRLSHLVLRVI